MVLRGNSVIETDLERFYRNVSFDFVYPRRRSDRCSQINWKGQSVLLLDVQFQC